MYDIVLVHVPYMFNTNPPLAAPLLKACLAQHGIKSIAVDLNIDFLKSKANTDSIVNWMQRPDIKPNVDDFKVYKDWIEEKAIVIASYATEYVGISVFTKDSQRAAEDLACAIVKRSPAKKIIIGGLGANVYQAQWDCNWYELLLTSAIAKVVIIGEGEKALIDVIKNKRIGLIKADQLTDIELDFVPLPDFSDYDLTAYTTDMDDESFAIPITASKGCVRNCTFCDVAKHWPEFRSRNGENVAREIIHYHNTYNFKYFRFTDSLINGNVKEFRLMNTRLAEEIPGQIKYRGQFICRPQNQMPKKDFELMAAAGAYKVQIGMESGSESVRDHMRKKFSNSDIEYCTYQLHDHGIKQSWFLFVGYPTETEEDFEETLTLLRKYGHLAKDEMLQIVPTGVFQMLDGTPLTTQEMMDELGIARHNHNGYLTYNWTSTKFPHNTFDIRAERFKKLVEVCKEYNLINDYENLIDVHLKVAHA